MTIRHLPPPQAQAFVVCREITTDPLVPAQLAFQAVTIEVPQAGRYDMVLVAGGDEIARQPLLIGPAEAFHGDG